MIPYFSNKSSSVSLIQSGFSKGVCVNSGENQEPKGPKIITDLPGPKTKELIEKLKPFQNVSNIELFANYGKSLGNYLQDVDGNILLDLNMQMATNPLGYNSTELKTVYQNTENIQRIINRPVLDLFPCDCWPHRIEDILGKISINLPNVSMFSCESTTIENAFKSMIMSFQKHQRDGKKRTLEDVKSAIKKKQPLDTTPKLSILSFKNSDHGSTMGALSASSTIASIWSKLDIPTFDWPVANYPNYRYPLEENECYNSFQDSKSLDMVKDLIRKWDDKDLPVVGVVVEPIQNECTQCPSSKFLQNLQEITNEIGIYLMIDETNTGCGATGKFWGIEHSCLKCPVDILAFGGKTQISGYLHSEDLISKEPGHILDKWMRDPGKLIVFEAIVNVIEKLNLLENVRKTGQKLKTSLLDMEVEHYNLIHSTRGLGTFLAFNAQCPKLRDDIWKRLRKKGILCGKCGEQGISIRPSLTFNEKHADIFLDKLEQVIKETELVDGNEGEQSKKIDSSSKCDKPKKTDSLSKCDKPKKTDSSSKCSKSKKTDSLSKCHKPNKSQCDKSNKTDSSSKCDEFKKSDSSSKCLKLQKTDSLSKCDKPKKSQCDKHKETESSPKCESSKADKKKLCEPKQKLSICDHSKKNTENQSVKCEKTIAHLDDVPTKISQMTPFKHCGDIGSKKENSQSESDKKHASSGDPCKKNIRKLKSRHDKKKLTCSKIKSEGKHDENVIDKGHDGKNKC